MKMKTLTNPRPKHNDDAIIRIAAEKLLPAVMAWIGHDDIPENEVLKDLTESMRYYSDGYEIAKDLDSYEPDAYLVKILDESGSLKSSAREKVWSEWVIANGLEGPELGAKVTSTARPNDGVGTVTGNWTDGRSRVAFPSAGHVTEGTGHHGLILEWETLIPELEPPQNDDNKSIIHDPKATSGSLR